MDTRKAIEIASTHLRSLIGNVFDLITIEKPTLSTSFFLVKSISKLSPLIGNMIEMNAVEYLNNRSSFTKFGKWVRQDPGFPDAIFKGSITPPPGLEIKAWFPLATEITARFKDSQQHFLNDNTYVVLLAWLPEHLIYGKPRIYDACIVSGRSVAEARDVHYHNPPDYLVLEPEDTSKRTINLQQTNTNGYKWQNGPKQLEEAKKIVESWGSDGRQYRTTPKYQSSLRSLFSKYKYRLNTNYAKMDRMVHPGIEEFKSRVFSTVVHDKTINDWGRLFIKGTDDELQDALRRHYRIKSAIVRRTVK